ncbi:MAG: aquaporin family protein [Muribaculaceae bacterium]|nr:aquaporin family protein [Muribaculaceae bacterium]
MENYILEFFGTLVLVLFGDGVCCACSLNKSKAQNAGWVVIALGWGLAVMMGALIAGPSGGHLNPAVSIGLALAGKFSWALVPGYIVAQMLGGFMGAVLVYLFYIDHFKATEDQGTKLGVFCTAPAIRNTWNNFFGEFVATFMLMFAILVMANFGGQVGLVGITWVITAIGMSLGATTGYAMNAARDLAPRVAHAVLPIPGKGGSDWGYSWIPVVAPIAGAACAAMLFGAMACCYAQ